MNIVEIAEFISAFAAFMTVCLAVAELASRSKAKKADIAIEVYADYLHIAQQLQYIIGTTESLAKKCSDFSHAELKIFAKNQLIPASTFELVQKTEKECICNFDYTSQSGKNKSQIILHFSGKVTNLMTSVNTLYNVVLDGEAFSPEFIQKNQQNIAAMYDKLVPEIEAVGGLLRQNLKKMHKSSNSYIAFLLISGAIFLALCFIL